MEKKIKEIELKHVRHWKKTGRRPDLHIAKERIHYDDGTSEPNIRYIKNFQRPFYITKPNKRVHKDKREFEKMENVNKFSCIQSNLPNNIAKRLGMSGYSRNQMWDVKNSPYLYGADVSSETFVTKMYKDKWNTINTLDTYCALDIEADIDTKIISAITIILDKEIKTYVNKTLVENVVGDVKARVIKKLLDKAPKDKIDISSFNIEVTVCDDNIDAIQKCFTQIHEWQPDILAAWNASYDFGVIIENLEAVKIDPVTIFSDPNCPQEWREFEFKEGQTVKITESGVRQNKDIHEVWHVYRSMASFYMLDAMATYNYIRVNTPKVFGGYGIDNIVRTEEVGSKLNLSDTKLLSGTIAWHKYMSKSEPINYLCYNIWDVVIMKALDEKTKDISLNLRLLSGLSSFDIFNSGPKRIIDSIFFYGVEKLNMVLGTAPRKQEGDKVLGLDEWINKITKCIQTSNLNLFL